MPGRAGLASRYDDHDRCSSGADQSAPDRGGEAVTGLHGSPDDNLVRVKLCRQSQQLGSDVTVNVNEGEVDVVVGGVAL